MGKKFIATSSYSSHIDGNDEAMADLARGLVGNPSGLLLVAGGTPCLGMIGVLTFRHPVSGEIVASEMFWWVEPEIRGMGVRLLRAAEEWATMAGAKRMMMIAPDDRVGDFYGRVGYDKVETTWMRRLA